MNGDTIRRLCCVLGLVIFFTLGATSWAQLSEAERWAAQVENAYEVEPNVTYLVANNYEAKLDVYYPPGVKAPCAGGHDHPRRGLDRGYEGSINSWRPSVPPDGLRGRERGVPPRQGLSGARCCGRLLNAPCTGLEEMRRSTTSISAK